MTDSSASPGQYAQKGRLEIMLDEFSELHGTVLIGMHRELQTHKQEVQSEVDTRLKDTQSEVDTRLKETRSGVDTQLKNARRSVETQLKDFLSQYAPAEDGLTATVSVAKNLDREIRALVKSAQAYQGDLVALQAKGDALGRQQQDDLAEMSARLLREFSHKGQQEVDRLIEDGRGMLDSNKDSLQKMLDEAMGKMGAVQKVSQSILAEVRVSNEENNKLLAMLRKDQASHAAEEHQVGVTR